MKTKLLVTGAMLCMVMSLTSTLNAQLAAPPKTGGDDMHGAVSDGPVVEDPLARPRLAEALKKLENLPQNKAETFFHLGGGAMPKVISVTNTAGPVKLYAHLHLEWYTTNDNYLPDAAAKTQQLYDTNGVMGEITDHRMKSIYIAQPVGNYNRATIWDSVRWESKSFDYKGYPGYLTGIGTSRDSNLNKTNFFSSKSYYYSTTSKGSTWGSPSDHRLSNNFANGYWPDTPVHEFEFPGFASKFYLTDTNGYTDSQLDAYLMSYPVDWWLTLQWVYYDGTNNPVSASITLHTKLLVEQGVLAARANDSTHVVLGINCSTNDSYILQSAPRVQGQSRKDMQWTDEGNINPGDTIWEDTTNYVQKYWQGKLQ